MNRNTPFVSDASVENAANVIALGSLAGAALFVLAALMGGKNSKALMTTALALVGLAGTLRKV